jgi:hypothetical protein
MFALVAIDEFDDLLFPSLNIYHHRSASSTAQTNKICASLGV